MISPPNVLSCRALVPADHFEEPARVQIHPAAHDPSGFFPAGGLPGRDLVN